MYYKTTKVMNFLKFANDIAAWRHSTWEGSEAWTVEREPASGEMGYRSGPGIGAS